MQPPGCPSATELSQFALGNLPGPALARLAGHVEACAACEQALQTLDGVADPLVARLRSDEATSTVDPLPQGLLAAARSARTPQSAAAWLPAGGPRRLGKFELREELGIGSFGYVFRAHDPELERPVAIKVLRAGRLAGHEEIDRFLREARSAAQLKHPGIVALYETGQTEDGTYYLVEEFIPGTTLASRMGAGRFGLREAAELAAGVAEALDYAHRHGVVHRDVTPSNIMLDQEGRPHLMDFGLAKREADVVPVTLEGQVLGTPAYMSPEQARGEGHRVDARSDVYSLGVVLYELLTGERPFGGNRRMLLLQVVQDEPRPPRRLNDKVPRDLETICLKAMAKEPARRYATAGELAADLRRWLGREPIRARPAGRAERLWRWCRRNPVAASLLIAVTLGSAFGLWHLTQLSQQLMEESALDYAAQQSLMLEQVHDLYSEQVKRVEDHGFVVSQETQQDGPPPPGKVPLLVPATFTHNVGQRISDKSESGVKVRLYSNYPFPFRKDKDGGPHDRFEEDALARLSERPGEPVHEFTAYEGRPVLRYAAAWVLKESCLKCHNDKSPDSPKRAWRVGEVRGALEIIRPLDKDVTRAQAGLRGTFLLMAAVSAALLGLSVLVLVVGNRRRPV